MSAHSSSAPGERMRPEPLVPSLGGGPAAAVVSPLWQFFRSIFQNAPEAIAMLDAGLRVVVWNKAAVSLTGHSTAETLGRQCTIDGHRITLDLRPGGNGDGAHVPRARLGTSCEFHVKTGAPAALPPWAATVIPLQYDGIVLVMLSRPALPDGAPGRSAGARASASRRTARPTRSVRAPTQGLRRLTRREQDILKLMAAGKTAKAIAGELSLSLPTVRSHTQHILRKLGVHSSLEAVVMFLRTRAGGSVGAGSPDAG